MIDEHDIWAFPDLHDDPSDNSLVERDYLDKEHQYQIQIEELTAQLQDKEQELQTSKENMTQYKTELENQISLLKKVSDEIHTTIPDISQYMLSFTDDIVKKITKKVIMKELSVEPALLKNLIDSLISKLESSELIQVSLSARNFARLSNIELASNIRLRINLDLDDTDVIASTDGSAMRMIIDDVLNHLMSGAYDTVN